MASFVGWLREVQCWHARLIEDEGGRPSLAKNNLMIGAAVGSVIVIKSMLLGTLTETMFALYLGFCAGHHLTSKWIDANHRGAKPGQDG